MELIACLLLYLVIKMEVLSYCKKQYQTWKKAVKILKKDQTAPTTTHKKNQILSYKFLDEYTEFSTPS